MVTDQILAVLSEKHRLALHLPGWTAGTDKKLASTLAHIRAGEAVQKSLERLTGRHLGEVITRSLARTA